MEKALPTFETLPSEVRQLNTKVDILLDLLSGNKTKDFNQWFDIDEVCEYIPGKPAKSTIYTLVSKREIPHNKKGKRLVFLQSEIDQWLKDGRRKTVQEVSDNAYALMK